MPSSAAALGAAPSASNGGQAVRGRAGVAAQRAGVGAIGQQQRQRAVPLGLQAERAAKLQRAGKPGRQRQRLTDQDGDGGLVRVAGQQRIGERRRAGPAARAPDDPANGTARRHGQRRYRASADARDRERRGFRTFRQNRNCRRPGLPFSQQSRKRNGIDAASIGPGLHMILKRRCGYEPLPDVPRPPLTRFRLSENRAPGWVAHRKGLAA